MATTPNGIPTCVCMKRETEFDHQFIMSEAMIQHTYTKEENDIVRKHTRHRGIFLRKKKKRTGSIHFAKDTRLTIPHQPQMLFSSQLPSPNPFSRSTTLVQPQNRFYTQRTLTERARTRRTISYFLAVSTSRRAPTSASRLASLTRRSSRSEVTSARRRSRSARRSTRRWR